MDKPKIKANRPIQITQPTRVPCNQPITVPIEQPVRVPVEIKLMPCNQPIIYEEEDIEWIEPVSIVCNHNGQPIHIEQYPKKIIERKQTIITQDGHFVFTDEEKIIDDILYNSKTLHAYKTKKDKNFGTFILPIQKLYIEFWEDKNIPERKESIRTYQKNMAKFIEINPEDMKNITNILKIKFLKLSKLTF
jgi:hypothetical protein